MENSFTGFRGMLLAKDSRRVEVKHLNKQADTQESKILLQFKYAGAHVTARNPCDGICSSVFLIPLARHEELQVGWQMPNISIMLMLLGSIQTITHLKHLA